MTYDEITAIVGNLQMSLKREFEVATAGIRNSSSITDSAVLGCRQLDWLVSYCAVFVALCVMVSMCEFLTNIGGLLVRRLLVY